MKRFALVFVVGCGVDSEGGGSSGDTSSGTTTTTTTTTTTSTTTPTTTTTGDSTSTSTGGTGSESGGDTTDAESTTGTTGPLDANGCPADAPSSWVSCERFDEIVDPAAEIAEWLVYEDAFGVEPEGGETGNQALRITLTPGLQYGGWVTLRFGDGPDGPGVDSPDERFDEVWVRYALRTAGDWPGYALGDVGELMVLDGANWGIAAEMAIRSDDGERLHPLGWSCIEDGVNVCDGSNDWSGALQLIWDAFGETVLFDEAGAGQWHCVEAHMRLNAPGEADGAAHVWVDGNEEIAVDNIDFLGTWDEFGLNGLRFTNFASPPAMPLDFWVDDVVVATERIGCE